MAAHLVLIAAFLTQRTQRRRAEDALRHRDAALRTSRHRIQQLAGELIHAQETARVEVARDLHDDICQDIVGIALSIDGVAQTPGRISDAKTQYTLAKLSGRTLDIAGRVRMISHDLHPATLQLLGLAAAVKAHCLEIETRYQAHVTFVANGDLKAMRQETALCLFRVAQEALRNAAVHGAARHFEVSLTRFGDDIELSIRDDGRGFDVESTRHDEPGLGLVSLGERVHAAGGEILIMSKPDEGTTLLVCVPAGLPPEVPTDIFEDVTPAVGAVSPRTSETSEGHSWAGHGC